MHIPKYLKNKKAIAGIIIIIIIVGGYFILGNRDGEGDYDTLTISSGDLKHEVDVVGKVKSQETVSLAFEQSGRVASIHASVGENVLQGQTLVRLENQNEYGAFLRAEANLSREKTILEELLRGARQEEIDVQNTKVQNAKQTLIEAEKDVVNKISDAFTKADDAVRGKADQLLDSPRGTRPSLKSGIVATDSQLVSDVESSRVTVENILNTQAIRNITLNTDSDLAVVIQDTKDDLGSIKTFLDKLALIVNGLAANSALSQATIDGYKTDITTARTGVNTALVNLTTSENALSVASSNVSLEEKQLVLLEAPATSEDIALQESLIASKEADLVQAQGVLSKTILQAPISGVVTMQDAKRGEIVNAGKPVVTIITEGRFEIEVFIPEADIARVKIADKATLTLDAYSDDDIFNAEVFSINPAETIIEGVATYKVILQLSDSDGRIRSGMTADVSILTDERSNVFSVPVRSIKTNDDGDKFIRIIGKGGSVEERVVETGLRSSDGRMEITSGLEENDEVIIFER